MVFVKKFDDFNPPSPDAYNLMTTPNLETEEANQVAREPKRQFFGTDGIRGLANIEPLTPETALRLGQAAALTLLRQNGDGDWPVCVIGRDTRASGSMLESALAAGMASVGVDVRLAGVIPTPAVAWLTKELGATAGVVISASHNPFHDNGIKFFGADGFKLSDETELGIEQQLLGSARIDDDARAVPAKIGRIANLDDAQALYVHQVVASANTDAKFLSGVKIALDAANGAAFQTSQAILAHFGADVTASFVEPSGLNINLDCGATEPDTIGRLVKESDAAVGVCLDGDADRIVLCDETGSALDGDELLAITATHLAKRGELTNNSIVATVMSNFGLNETLANLGGEVVRTAVGDRYVVEKMRELGLEIGGEQSGHLIFLKHSTTGDGMLGAIQILQIMAAENKPLIELRKCLSKFPQAKRYLTVKSKPPLEELAEAQKLIAETERELGDQGRVLLRYSGTEPMIRLLMEGRDENFINAASDRIATALIAQIG
ncbi:MAG: phosphoglucosamine mutase [Verrucomicrobiales bacterium]|jgi:phosphoglucosamine mutase